VVTQPFARSISQEQRLRPAPGRIVYAAASCASAQCLRLESDGRKGHLKIRNADWRRLQRPRFPFSYLWTGNPLFHTARILRVSRMFFVGSPSTSSKSARLPGDILPRSERRYTVAGADVAATSAWIGVSRLRTSSSSSPCTEAPYVAPGAGASVPVSRGTPA
jgi:hypothetical protein